MPPSGGGQDDGETLTVSRVANNGGGSSPGGNVIYIDATVDEADMSPSEFRVFAHIARRGECYEAPENMAVWLRLHPDTIWAALKVLTLRRMILRTKRPGQTTLFKINHNSNQWLPTGKKGAPEKKGHRKPSARRRKRRGDRSPEKKGHKVHPIEVHPIKGENPPGKAGVKRAEGGGEGKGPKLFPDEFKEKRRDLRDRLGRLPPGDSRRAAIHQKLSEIETDYFGYAETPVTYGDDEKHKGDWAPQFAKVGANEIREHRKALSIEEAEQRRQQREAEAKERRAYILEGKRDSLRTLERDLAQGAMNEDRLKQTKSGIEALRKEIAQLEAA